MAPSAAAAGEERKTSAAAAIITSMARRVEMLRKRIMSFATAAPALRKLHRSRLSQQTGSGQLGNQNFPKWLN
jgi:hypothetical protein